MKITDSMKKILNAVLLVFIMAACAACKKDKFTEAAPLIGQWEVMSNEEDYTYALLDFSKKQFVYRYITSESLLAPEILYDDSHIVKIRSVAKLHDEAKGEVWDVQNELEDHLYFYDVTESSAKLAWYDLDTDAWEVLHAVPKRIKMRYHYVPASAVDLGLSVYWARFDMHFDPFFNDLDPEADIIENYHYDVIQEDWVYTPGDFYAWSDSDPVHERFGGKWRMPTFEEYQELYNSMAWAYWTPDEYYVFGQSYGQSKKPGFEADGITFIMNGYYSGTTHKSDTYGFYWTSKTDDDTNAYVARFMYDSHMMSETDFLEIPRSEKCNIRPVWDPKM